MTTFSTCRRCRTKLQVTNENDTVHPTCEPVPTRLEELYARQELYALAEIQDGDELDRLLAETQKLEDERPPLGRAALRYASWGWPVFPLQAGQKMPATPHGFKDATSNERRISLWWRFHPDHNIGLATGHRFDVIDVDLPDGPASYEAAPPGTWSDVHGIALTAGGGRHYYVEPTGDGCTTGMAPGIDYRGLGGYVVAPPSRIDPTHKWRFLHVPSPVITGEKEP